MKCVNCECDRFFAHQLCRLDVIVDEHNNWVCNDGKSPIYDSETPYGPFTCVKCKAEYDTIT